MEEILVHDHIDEPQSSSSYPAELERPASSEGTGTAKDFDSALVNPRQSNFQSSIYTIIVGLSKEVFTAHCDILSLSKVLGAQCSGGFQEEHSKVILLRESDPKIFASVLEYLYRGDYWPAKGNEFSRVRSADQDVRATQMRREVDIYCMADYYDLPNLQELVVEKMQMLTPLALESFLDMSEYIYDHGGPKGPFRPYFREQMGEFVPREAIRPWIDGKESISAEFAKDLFLSDLQEVEINVVVDWPSGRKVQSENHALSTEKESLRKKFRSSKKNKVGKSRRHDMLAEPVAEPAWNPTEVEVQPAIGGTYATYGDFPDESNP